MVLIFALLCGVFAMTKSTRGGVRQGAGRPKSEDTKMMRIPVNAEPLLKHLINVYKNHPENDFGALLRRANRFPDLESEALFLQLADHRFRNFPRLVAFLKEAHPDLVLRDDEQLSLLV